MITQRNPRPCSFILADEMYEFCSFSMLFLEKQYKVTTIIHICGTFVQKSLFGKLFDLYG